MSNDINDCEIVSNVNEDNSEILLQAKAACNKSISKQIIYKYMFILLLNNILHKNKAKIYLLFITCFYK